jgi:iron complex outermembrane receptor protein
VVAAVLASTAGAQTLQLVDLSLEELANIEVTSVSGRAEALSGAAASIYVITSDDIRRSGATTLPEVLRLAPNLLVARVDTAQYAISARGFNSAIANKLLVLIDGRTVYTPLFSGVFWEMQDLMLEDISRIEVISGPGATLWGANAVNGVINVITRPANDTAGTLAVLGTGNRERRAAVRYGGGLGQDGAFRVYAKAADQQNTERADGAHVRDAWNRAQAGFRADLYLANGSLTLQTDAYAAESEQRGAAGTFDFGRLEGTGVNVLSRWTRRLGDGSDLRVQAYFDRSERVDAVLFAPESNVFDVEAQHSIPLGAHQLLWGGGYRRGSDDVTDGLLFGFRPPQRDLDWANVFAQADLAIAERLDLTLGLKLEQNDYTGTESLPTARIAWHASPAQLVWAGVSRAVRAPSRLDREVILPPPSGALIAGGPNFVAEVADVIELGYRAQLGGSVTLSSTVFHYDWDKLRSGRLPPALIENRIEGEIYGIEAWTSWQAAERWRLSAGLTTLRNDLRVEPGVADPQGPSALGNDPEVQWLLRSTHDLNDRQDLQVLVRRVDDLPQPAVPAYTAVDVTYAWQVRANLTVALAVQNLFDARHPESGGAANRSEYARAGYLSVTFGAR